MWNKKKIILALCALVSTFVVVLCYLAFDGKDPIEVVKAPAPAPIETISKMKLSELKDLCSKGDPESCLTLGYIHLRGVVGERNFVQAKNYFEMACDNFKDADQREIQCEAIAKIFETGKEARADRKIAIIFHEKAQAAHLAYVSGPKTHTPDVRGEDDKCSKGDMGSCVQLAEKFEFGRRGIGQDLEKAGKIYQRACEFNNGMICDLAGTFFRDKGSNTHVAISLYQRGCRVGSQSACEHLKKLGGDLEDSM